MNERIYEQPVTSRPRAVNNIRYLFVVVISYNILYYVGSICYYYLLFAALYVCENVHDFQCALEKMSLTPHPSSCKNI